MMIRNLHFIFAVAVIISGAVSFSSHAAHASVNGDLRRSNFNFVPNVQLLRNGNIENFFQVYDQDGKPKLDSGFQNQYLSLDSLLSLDSNNTYRLAQGKNEKVYAFVAKVAYIIKKDVQFLERKVLDVRFWQAVQPQLNVFLNPSESANGQEAFFKMRGSGFVPSADLNLKLYKMEKASDVSGIQIILSEDRALGDPAFVTSEYYTNFGTVLRQQTNLESRTINKYYSLQRGETLVISYGLVYPYRLVPGLFGGLRAMREVGVTKIQDLIHAIENQN